MAAIGERITLLGLALAGLEVRREVEDPKEAIKHINELSLSGRYGIILITSNIYRGIKKEIEEKEAEAPLPIFIEIPEVGSVGGEATE